ncbi:MAG TPA: IS4 family transposase [Chloroflexota bacterium]|nr:IS4 family transposase [Chloroflexota bacterium]
MINYQPFPTEAISIVPPPDAQADPRTRLDRLRARFARNDGLPFADVLTEARVHDVLNEHGVRYRDRVFNPVTTIWGFLSQVLSDDHSCNDAVTRIIAHRAASGQATCSPNNASYCNARGRLPTAVLCTLAKRTARELQAAAAEEWKWNGRSVFIADGSHVSMPDTPENQAAYPQPPTQEPGVGFPLARVVVLLSLATGACHDLAIAPYEGKGTGETTLLRAMYGALRPGDVVLADALFDNYFLICELRRRGIDVVVRAQYERVGSQVLQGRPDGEILLWRRPNKPRGMTGRQYRQYPEVLLMRQVTVDARDKENRAERFKVITTILDAAIDGGQIGDLYERRWEGEVDIRSIKSVMHMDILRCKTPEMVRKEIWAHLLAYNLLRTVMAVAAAENGLEPRQVSFKGAKQAVTAFAPKLEAARPKARPALIDALLAVIAYHRVGDRPGRWEPRARKRRRKPGAYLHEPRAATKQAKDRSKWF